MKQNTIVIDHFYDIPFEYHKSDACLITDETVKKLTYIIGNSIEIVSATNEVGNTDGVVAHLASDWIGIVYLSLPVQSFGDFGIKFYSHLSTGLEEFPTKEEMVKFNLEENKLTDVFSSDLNLWKEYGCIPAQYNRLILFKSSKWHSYTLNSHNRYQKIIIRNV